MHRLIAACLLLLSLLSAGIARADETSIAYGPDPQEQLDICVPQAPAPGAPGVLLIHGGGWRVGSRRGLAGVCKHLARQGIVVFNMDYRLLTAARETKWPVQIEDAQLAMRWARAHAAAYGANPSFICAEGDSAGGHLALLLDVLGAIHPGDRQGMLPNVSPRAQCVVDISGISDLVSIDAAHPGYANFLIGSSDAAVLHQQKIDGLPALHVQAGDGPAFLLHGLSDPAVPYSQATEMQAAFARVGTPAWLISHEGGHEMNGMTKEQMRDIWTVIGGFIKTRGLAGMPSQMSVDQVVR